MVSLPRSLEFFEASYEVFYAKRFQFISANDRQLVISKQIIVSKETVVLRRLESETRKFDFIKRVDKGRITTMKDSESWRFDCQPFVRGSVVELSF